MTLRRKESRRIEVDGRSYRWMVGPNDEGLAIIAEHESGHGQRMVTRWFPHEKVISLVVVKEAILHALTTGQRLDSGRARAGAGLRGGYGAVPLVRVPSAE